MRPLLSSRQIRSAEKHAIDKIGIPEILLMEHAARAVAEALRRRFQSLLPRTRGLVVAGVGNNGGDAMAAARLLRHFGVTEIALVLVGSRQKLSPSAALQLKILAKMGIKPRATFPSEPDWVIDGLFGIGLSREISGPELQTIRDINSLSGCCWVVAVDIPSGLGADTGIPMPEAVQACETVTFGFDKRGLYTGLAADYVGKAQLATIQIPRVVPHLSPETFLFETDDARALLPRRIASGHKGAYGHVHAWAGRLDKQGAAALCALGALRAGAGLATVFGPAASGLRPRLIPEIMTTTELPGSGVIAIGPGMGTDEEARKVLEWAVQSRLPLVVDADALTFLSKGIFKSLPVVITPHPKEAARLLGIDTAHIQADRFSAARELARRFHCTVVLKGKGTIVTEPSGPLTVVTTGDSSLSKGGTGDLLCGIIASLMAQGLSPVDASRLGAYLHGAAAEWLSQEKGTERATLASEIAESLPYVFKELECPRFTSHR